MRIAMLGLLCALALPGAGAQESGAFEASLSRSMRLGIKFYDKGDDARAMDQFMDVLTHGAVSERPLANDYINLITHRMNTGENLPLPPRPEIPEPAKPPRTRSEEPSDALKASPVSRRAAQPEVIVEPMPAEEARGGGMVEAPPQAARRAPRGAPVDEKALMKKEIKAKIGRLMESSLRKIKALDGVELSLREDGRPAAIGVPSGSLFQSGVAFKKAAASWLEALTALTYSLSGAQLVILPEGASLSEAKMLDMRRTMGISAHLYSAGIAPARVRVNLLNSQVDIPRAVAGFKGMVVIFLYDQPLKLAMDSPAGEDAGPALSLGVFPESLRSSQSDGAIIEFSVQEAPSGLLSWEFKILKPVSEQTLEAAPLQDVAGASPVYHQVFWNGRQNYFGDALPPGRYECVLSAMDAKNRRRSVRRWINVLGVPLPAAQAVPKEEAGAPPAELSGAAKSALDLLKPTRPLARSARKIRKPKRKKAKKPVKRKQQTSAPRAGEP